MEPPRNFKLKPFQEKLVKIGIASIKRNQGKILRAPTGSGKTAMAFNIMEGAETEYLKHCLVLVPSLAGTVPKQWEKEGPKWGVSPNRIFIYHGSRRNDEFDEWYSKFDKDMKTLLYIITTSETLAAEYRKEKKQRGLITVIDWSHCISDEMHRWRNGTHRFRHDDVDETKKIYTAIDLHVARRCKPTFLMLSATPFVNHKMDLFPVLRWLTIKRPAELRKKVWLAAFKYEDKQEEFEQEKNRLLTKYYMDAGKLPFIPSPTIEEIKHEPSDSEITELKFAHSVLAAKTRKFIAAVKGIACEHPLPAAIKDFEDAKLKWTQQLTICRRGILHPGFYEQPQPLFSGKYIDSYVEIVNGKVYIDTEPHIIDWRMDNKTRNESFKDSDGNAMGNGKYHNPLKGYLIEVAYPNDDQDPNPERLPTYKGICKLKSGGNVYTFPNPVQPINPYKYLKEFDLSELSRFQSVIEIIKELGDQKVMIVASYKQPLQLLTHYVKEIFPDRRVLEHYGGSNNWPIIQAFHKLGEASIMLATRSSISEAVSIECCNNMICMDPATSDAQDKQMRGRIIRPLANKFENYYTFDTLLDGNYIDQWAKECQTMKKVQADLFLCGDDENTSEAELETPEKLNKPTMNALRTLLDIIGRNVEAEAATTTYEKQLKKTVDEQRKKRLENTYGTKDSDEKSERDSDEHMPKKQTIDDDKSGSDQHMAKKQKIEERMIKIRRLAESATNEAEAKQANQILKRKMGL